MIRRRPNCTKFYSIERVFSIAVIPSDLLVNWMRRGTADDATFSRK